MTAIPHPLHSAGAHHDDAHAHGHEHHEIGFVKKYVFSVDHKIIGLQFLFLGLMFFVIGGLEAMLVRWQLGFPDQPVPLLGEYMKSVGAAGWNSGSMPPDFYTQAFTMHASIMIFFVIIPLLVGTFGNYLIPLKIGAGDMAFPFMNGLALWSAFPAGAIMMAAFFVKGGPPMGGWTSYPPLGQMHLAPPGSTWPMMPILLTYFALFLAVLFVCAYYVRLGHRAINIPVSVVISLVSAWFLVRGIQKV